MRALACTSMWLEGPHAMLHTHDPERRCLPIFVRHLALRPGCPTRVLLHQLSDSSLAFFDEAFSHRGRVAFSLKVSIEIRTGSVSIPGEDSSPERTMGVG